MVKRMSFIERLGNSRIWNLLLFPAGKVMGSSMRRLVFKPESQLKGAGITAGQIILEVGCGTGFFTLSAAKMVGGQGCIIAMDLLSGYVEQTLKKVQKSNLNNARIVQGNALSTGLEDSTIDKVLLFGVIPFPTLPLNRLLPEMHRILKPDGTIAVWLFPVAGVVPNNILKSGLFSFINKQNGVYNYKKV
jgi:demethylmenaquinone methyltransferase/2-methoxy-6-polyprenyl-1,4-benzoquinol methylase